MGNQNGKQADRSVDVKVARSPARTKLNDVASAENETNFDGEKADAGTSTTVEVPRELTSETDTPIDKYQVVETAKEVTLEVSTMATEVGSSEQLPLKEEVEEKEEKDKGPFIDIAEVDDVTKDGAKSPLVLKSDETTEVKDKSIEDATPDEKPSNVSAGERDLLLGKGAVSGELSESVMSTSPNKMKRLTQPPSFFKSCLFCIPNATS